MPHDRRHDAFEGAGRLMAGAPTFRTATLGDGGSGPCTGPPQDGGPWSHREADGAVLIRSLQGFQTLLNPLPPVGGRPTTGRRDRLGRFLWLHGFAFGLLLLGGLRASQWLAMAGSKMPLGLRRRADARPHRTSPSPSLDATCRLALNPCPWDLNCYRTSRRSASGLLHEQADHPDRR